MKRQVRRFSCLGVGGATEQRSHGEQFVFILLIVIILFMNIGQSSLKVAFGHFAFCFYQWL